MSAKSAAKFLILFAFILVLPTAGFARIGVGVGIGKVHVDETLKAGGIYDLPSVPVLNTGDEPADYHVTAQYHEGQETNPAMGLRPAEQWFNFTPSAFHLESGAVQTVKVTLTLPTKIQPGDYFAYLEARPTKKATVGETAIGIAAATQLWFTVDPANFLQGIYYRFISLYLRCHPWDTIILAVIALAFLLRFMGKRFKIQISRKKKKKR
jgi:hypothetical protein